MGKGLVSGLIWGAFVAIIVLALLSLGTPLPERPASAARPVETPVPAPTAQAPSEPAAAPTDETTGTTETAGAAPAAGQGSRAPASEIPLPAGSEFNRPPEESSPAIPGIDSAPALPPQAITALPAPSVPPLPDTTPAPQPQAAESLQGPGAAPGVEPLASAPEAAPSEPAAPQVAAEQPAPLGLPQIETDPEAQTAPAPLGRPLQPVSGQGTGDAEGPQRAIDAFAAAFAAEESRPLMAVVLIDDPSFPLGREVLTGFDFPVSFAIDPRRPDAAEAAAAYRAAGFEVLLLGEVFTEEATGADVPAILERAFTVLPEAVAVLDTPGEAIQGRREVLEGVVASLTETGHGLIAFPRGLPVAEQAAGRNGVPAATLFREIDSERERAPVIIRYLDRAAFAAEQEGSVIVVGHTYSDTVTALFSWALGDRSGAVALAPVSAVLTR